jgi:hypothetical protein
MRKAIRIYSAACVAAIAVLMFTPTIATAQPFQGSLKVKGQEQGKFKGEGTQQGSKTTTATTGGAAVQKSSGGSRR